MAAFYTPVFERGWVERTKREAEEERRKNENLQYESDPQEEPQNN